MKNNRLLYLLIIILAIWCAVLSFRFGETEKKEDTAIINQYEVDGFSTDLTKVVDEVKSGVVTINADGSILSGFVYRQEDDSVYILSAYHGVSNVNSITVRFGTSYSVAGELVGHDIFTDLALIRIRTPYLIEPLKLADASLLKQGEFVISIGTPVSFDLQGSVELSLISKNNFQIENSILVEDERYSYFLNVIQLGNGLANGYSGSPLINMDGEVVGMSTMSTQGLTSFALTANEVRIVADQLISSEPLSRRFLGIKGAYLNGMFNYEKANLNIGLDTLNGLYVERVRENSIAFNAGIRPGDVIVKINGEEISDLNSYLRAIYGEGDEVSFEYIRGGETVTASPSDD